MKGFMTVERHQREMREAGERFRQRCEVIEDQHKQQIRGMHKLIDEARIYNTKVRRPRPEGPLLYTVQATFDAEIAHYLVSGVPSAIDVIAKDVYYRIKHELEMLAKFNMVPR